MLQKIEILDKALDNLDHINNSKFMFEKFKEINQQIETILVEIKTNDLGNDTKNFSDENLNIFRNVLNKIEKLEAKILPKAHLFESFSKSNP